MMFLDLVNVSGNNPILIILFAILFIVIIAILLLLYLQNKEMHENITNVNTEIKEGPQEAIKKETMNDNEDLLNLTRELEQMPKEHNIDMTQYEVEQEKTAIISYEELVNQAKENDIGHNNDELIREIKVNNYQHEEEFLNNLKRLKSSLN